MLRQLKIVVCLEGWYYLVVMGFILAGAMLREINLLIVLFGLMVGPLLYNWRSVVVSLRTTRFRRKAPREIQAGDLLSVEIEARSLRRWLASWALVVQDRLQRQSNTSDAAASEARVLLERVPAGGMCRASYQGRLGRRGVYHLGPLRVSTRFPLGLVQRIEVIDQTSTLTVLPRLGRLTRGWTRRQGEATQGTRRDIRLQGSLEGDYHGLRDFRSGDSRRWIHWRTSARRGQLMVREFEQQRNQDLCLLLDLWQPEEPDPEHLEYVELAVSFAATVISDRCRRGGSQLLVCTAADEVSLRRGPASSALLQEMMGHLATVEASSLERLPQLLADALDVIRPGASVVLITTRPTLLAEHARFGEVWQDPRRQAWLGRILTIDTSSEQLTDYFHLD